MWNRKDGDRKRGKCPVRVEQGTFTRVDGDKEIVVLPERVGLALGLKPAMQTVSRPVIMRGTGPFGSNEVAWVGVDVMSRAEGYLTEFVLPLEWKTVVQTKDEYHWDRRIKMEMPGKNVGFGCKDPRHPPRAQLRVDDAAITELHAAAVAEAAELLGELEVLDITMIGDVVCCSL